MKTGMLFSRVFARLQTASLARFASPCLPPPSGSPQLGASEFHACNLFRFNTYEPSRKCGKQRTYRKPKSFRCNTYKKHRGWGVLWLTRHSVRGVCPVYPEPRRERPSGEKDLSLTPSTSKPSCVQTSFNPLDTSLSHSSA